MKEIGSQLKEVREQKKLSVQDVAIATKINSKIIKAIEDGESENLPAKPFLRGFIQSYARYLELDVDDIMKRFLESHGSTKPKPQITEEGRAENASHEEVQNKFEFYKKIAYAVAAIIAVVFIYFIQKIVNRYEQESKVAKEQKEVVKSQFPNTENIVSPIDVASPISSENKPAEAKPVEVKPIEAKPVEVKSEAIATPPPQKPVIPPTPVPVPPITKPVEAKPAQPKPIEAKPLQPKPVETKPIEVKPVAPKVSEPKPAEAKTNGKSQQLIIEALDNVEIRYSKDGESERTVKLKPEQYLTIKSNSKINLHVSDSGAVNIIHNGRDKGVPGNLGQPAKISYP